MDLRTSTANVFQNFFQGGGLGSIAEGGLSSAFGEGGFQPSGLIGTGAEAFHSKTRVGQFMANVSSNMTGGVLNAEGHGDAAQAISGYFMGDYGGAIRGALDLLENFESFDVKYTGVEGLLKKFDPTGEKLAKVQERFPALKIVNPILKGLDWVKEGPIGKIVEQSHRKVGAIAKKVNGVLGNLNIFGNGGIQGLLSGDGIKSLFNGDGLRSLFGGGEGLLGLFSGGEQGRTGILSSLTNKSDSSLLRNIGQQNQTNQSTGLLQKLGSQEREGLLGLLSFQDNMDQVKTMFDGVGNLGNMDFQIAKNLFSKVGFGR